MAAPRTYGTVDRFSEASQSSEKSPAPRLTFAALDVGERFLFATDNAPWAGCSPWRLVHYREKTGERTFASQFSDGQSSAAGRVGVGDNPVYRVAALAEHEP